MENNQNYEKNLSNKFTSNPNQEMRNRPDRYEDNRNNSYGDTRYNNQVRPEKGNEGIRHDSRDQYQRQYYEQNQYNKNYDQRNPGQYNRYTNHKNEPSFNRRDGGHYGYDNKYPPNNRDYNQDRHRAYTDNDNTHGINRDPRNEKKYINEPNPINILKAQDEWQMANNPSTFTDNVTESKIPTDVGVIQECFKLDLNILTAIMVHQNNENKKLIAKLANQPLTQVEEISKKEYYKFFADLKNKQENDIFDDNDKEMKFMDPSNIPVFVIDENRNKSFYDAIANHTKKIDQTNTKICEIRKKIEKENWEVKKLKDKIHDNDINESKLNQKLSEVKKTLDDIFSDY